MELLGGRRNFRESAFRVVLLLVLGLSPAAIKAESLESHAKPVRMEQAPAKASQTGASRVGRAALPSEREFLHMHCVRDGLFKMVHEEGAANVPLTLKTMTDFKNLSEIPPHDMQRVLEPFLQSDIGKKALIRTAEKYVPQASRDKVAHFLAAFPYSFGIEGYPAAKIAEFSEALIQDLRKSLDGLPEAEASKSFSPQEMLEFRHVTGLPRAPDGPLQEIVEERIRGIAYWAHDQDTEKSVLKWLDSKKTSASGQRPEPSRKLSSPEYWSQADTAHFKNTLKELGYSQDRIDLYVAGLKVQHHFNSPLFRKNLYTALEKTAKKHRMQPEELLSSLYAKQKTPEVAKALDEFADRATKQIASTLPNWLNSGGKYEKEMARLLQIEPHLIHQVLEPIMEMRYRGDWSALKAVIKNEVLELSRLSQTKGFHQKLKETHRLEELRRLTFGRLVQKEIDILCQKVLINSNSRYTAGANLAFWGISSQVFLDLGAPTLQFFAAIPPMLVTAIATDRVREALIARYCY